MLIIGKEEAIDDAIKVLQGHFQVKDPTSSIAGSFSSEGSNKFGSLLRSSNFAK